MARDWGTAGELRLSKCRLPVPRGHELIARQELSADQTGTCEVGAVEHGLEEIRPIELSVDQHAIAQIRSPQVRLAKIGLGEVGADEIKAKQMRSGEIGTQIQVRRSPRVPRAYAVLEHLQLCLVGHGLFLQQQIHLSRINREAMQREKVAGCVDRS